METIYERIRKRRKELNMSQEVLAQKVGYKEKSAIAHIEKGRKDIPQSKIIAIAEALNTTTSYLMDGYDINAIFNQILSMNSMDQMLLINRLIDTKQEELTFTDLEKEIIQAFRQADAFDQTTVLRTLGLEKKGKHHQNQKYHRKDITTCQRSNPSPQDPTEYGRCTRARPTRSLHPISPRRRKQPYCLRKPWRMYWIKDLPRRLRTALKNISV